MQVVLMGVIVAIMQRPYIRNTKTPVSEFFMILNRFFLRERIQVPVSFYAFVLTHPQPAVAVANILQVISIYRDFAAFALT